MNGTISVRLEDMRLFAELAEAGSISRASRATGVPKQTISRRLAQLESDLGVQLLDRMARRVSLTAVGRVYAERCAEVAALAERANAALRDEADTATGRLRLAADPIFGEAFLADLLRRYAEDQPRVQLDVYLTGRRVDFASQDFDAAFRVAEPLEPGASGVDMGAAEMRYCASPGYLERHGTPSRPGDLRQHACIALVSEQAEPRWIFRIDDELRWLPVRSRVRINNPALARRLALSGFGIANLSAAACGEDLESGRLVSVLDDWLAPFGQMILAYPEERFLVTRLRRFLDLAIEHVGASAPWILAPDGDQQSN